MKITFDLSQLIQTEFPPQANLRHGAYHRLLSKIIPPFIKVLLEQTQGNKSAAARIAGLNRATLDTYIKRYHIVIEQKVRLLCKEEV